jgi:hypothetical protein
MDFQKINMRSRYEKSRFFHLGDFLRQLHLNPGSYNLVSTSVNEFYLNVLNHNLTW